MTTQEMLDEKDDIHVIPKDGWDHQESPTCLCNPIWDEENKSDYLSGEANVKMWVHKIFWEVAQ